MRNGVNKILVVVTIFLFTLFLSPLSSSLTGNEPGLIYENGELVGWELQDIDVKIMIAKLIWEHGING